MNNNNSDPFGEAAAERGQGTTQQTPQNADQAAKAAEQGAAQTQANQDLLQAMYGSSDASQVQDGTPAANQAAQANPQQKQAVDQQQLDAVRKKLHLQRHQEIYYNPTFNAQKREETNQQRLEREKKEDEQKKMQDLEKKEKKNQTPIAVSRGQTSAERQRGAAG